MSDATGDIDIAIELTSASRGVWWVTTESGAVHVWDMDAGIVVRARPNDDAGMRWDGTPLTIVSVPAYPKIGHAFGVVLAHPGSEDRVALRMSTPVAALCRCRRRTDEP